MAESTTVMPASVTPMTAAMPAAPPVRIFVGRGISPLSRWRNLRIAGWRRIPGTCHRLGGQEAAGNRRDALRSRGRLALAEGNDLVEFAAIEPHAATLGAVVDLDALAFAHHEIDTAYGAREALMLGLVGIGHLVP